MKSSTSKGRFPLQPYRTETYRISLFPSTRVELMVSTQKKILRYVTIRLKWKPALKQALPTYLPEMFTLGKRVNRLGKFPVERGGISPRGDEYFTM